MAGARRRHVPLLSLIGSIFLSVTGGVVRILTGAGVAHWPELQSTGALVGGYPDAAVGIFIG